MNGMSLEEIYEMLKEEDERFERWRGCNPCCANCQHYYEEYGCELCKLHEAPPDEVTDVYKGRCEDWR